MERWICGYAWTVTCGGAPAACAGPTAAPTATVLIAIAANMAVRVRLNED